MIKKAISLIAMVAMLLSMVAIGTGPVSACGYTYVEDWDGRGDDSLDCFIPSTNNPRYDVYMETGGWIHWVFSTKGESTSTKLVLGGTGSGEFYPGHPLTANVWHFYTPYFELDGLTATIYLYGGDPGSGGGLVISDYCPGDPVGYEELTVSKTAVTSYIRTHNWDIDKSVETENEEFVNGTPKIWLDGPGDEGDETATWTVDVTYEGYTDSDWNVSGEIIIVNTGTLDAVITSIDDVLGGTSINVDCGCIGFPYTLPVGETLACAYSEDGYFEGFNEVTVTTQREEYFADAEIIWGDPDEEINKTVNIKDVSDLFDEVTLGTVTAPAGAQFTYTKDFKWADYGRDACSQSFTYDNTASIVETDQSASATLKVNIRCEELTVSKTAVTSYSREHFWDIAKKVETEYGHELDDVAKIWLYIDGRGNEIATWTVDVSYEGYEDSGFNVSGVITIENTGQLDAVIEGIEDLLAGAPITLADGPGLPYTLPVGETITYTYSEDGYVEGFNVVTVTTERDEYGDSAAIVWGEPTTEVNKTVVIVDDSDLFGEVELGEATAPEGVTFTYSKPFAWADYGQDDCGSYLYNNTATIVETGQYAKAKLKVNVQCYIYETAYAKGDDAVCFIPTFSNWGWTNPIMPGTYEMPLWAAAGQCDTSRGTLVGSVTVVYDDDGYVIVGYNVDAPYILNETHVYAGTTMFPQQQRGRRMVNTVAPGQYYNASPFDGSQVYVIAHAVVGLPDPNFGP